MLQYKEGLFYGEKWTQEGREFKEWKKEIMEVEVTVQFSCSVVSNSVTTWTAARQRLRCQESLKETPASLGLITLQFSIRKPILTGSPGIYLNANKPGNNPCWILPFLLSVAGVGSHLMAPTTLSA